jgi:NADP-reducing hydrogenase subunit HndD
MVNITINGKDYQFDPHMTVLEACKQAGIKIPTLCFLEGKAPFGACRVCLIEQEGAPRLSSACSTPLRDGMMIKTNTKRVREARRTVVELLLSEHHGDCMYCDRSYDCELQDMARTLDIDVPEQSGEKSIRSYDSSTPALERDTGKCIKCRRCVSVCSGTQAVSALSAQDRGFATLIGPAFSNTLDTVSCVQCGQCAAVCPTGAITEKTHIPGVVKALEDPEKYVIVQTAPAIRAALGEEFGLEPGTRVTGKMVQALRNLGFDQVFDTNFTADLTILEEGTELLMRLQAALGKAPADFHGPTALPQFTSCSPGWIKYTEHFWPEYIPNLSTCKSPQQMMGALAKTWFADSKKIDRKNLVVVSVMPCTAKKFEAGRDEMNDSGFQDVDYVLTTRELARLIKMQGIDFVNLEDAQMDAPLGISTGAADIFANTGGVMEAALRTVYKIVTGDTLPMEKLHVQPIMGLEGVKKVEVTFDKTVDDWKFLEGVTARFAVAHGLSNAATLLEEIAAGKEQYHFVEVMTCPGGCIGGGGQPRFTDNSIREKRIAAIYQEDEHREIRQSHENPAVQSLYKDYLKKPLGEISHKLLHTSYKKRSTQEF